MGTTPIKTLFELQLYFLGKYVFDPVHPIHKSSKNIVVAAFMFDFHEGNQTSLPVVIKFFTHNNGFKREAENRMNISETAEGIVPIIYHYSTIGNMPIH